MSMKFSFTLDDDDLKYFAGLLRDARKYAKSGEQGEIISAVRGVVAKARATPKLPSFASEAIDDLEALINMVEDKDWALPRPIADRVLAALAYFAQPEDLIPDAVPGLGFLDDAIMIKIVEGEFRHDLEGYRKFVKFREGAEQRPWTSIARERLPRRLREKRDELRAEVERKNARDLEKGYRGLIRW
jgi:uncharacterized membrane protein YkvA (DUF1232 family)